MTDRSQSIANMTTAPSMELSAFNRHLERAGTFEDWRLDSLASRLRDARHDELGRVEHSIDHIIFPATKALAAAKVPKMAETALTFAFVSGESARG